MSGIPEEVIERVRDVADLVDVIGEHVQLKRTGSDYRGSCPFHGGTHRNFAVIPKKQMYYCFVCHEGGDVFTFFMKKFGMDYPTAVREVARKVGVPIPERSTGGPDPREPLYSAVGVAHDWFTRQLREEPAGGAAREYLGRRGFALEALLPYTLGWAPAGKVFLAAMQTLGLDEAALIAAGLAVRRDEGPVRARFWERLLFPIHDLRGRVVGFGGRRLDDGEPKYLNSPDSEVFHKGQLLYNLHAARHAIRKVEEAVIVEGYFDVLRLVEAGLEHVVAPLGTGFTPDQARLLGRFSKRVTLLFDSDSAGLRATFRTADELLRAGLRVSVATMPDGEDPDTLVRAGGVAAVRSVLHDAVDVLERKLGLLERRGWLADLAGRRRALDRLLPTLRAATDPVTRDLYVGRISEALGISRTSIMREVEHTHEVSAHHAEPGAGRFPPEGGVIERGRTRRRGGSPDRDLVRVALHEPEWRSRIAEQIRDRPPLTEPEGSLLHRLAALGTDEPADGLLEILEPEPRVLLAELMREEWGGLDIDAMVAGAVNRLESRQLERELHELERRIPLAAEEEKLTLVRRVDTLSRQIAKLNPGRWNVIRKGRSSAR